MALIKNLVANENSRKWPHKLFGTWRVTLQRISHGNYCFSPPYSPHLKPIEKCFALVKSYIKEHEDEALLHPFAFIQHTFSLFAVDGARAGSVKGHWQGYFAAREVLVNDE